MLKKLLFIMLLVLLFTFDGKKTFAEQTYVTLTFDDGWASVYENAYPILKKYNFPATLFVITDGISRWEGFMSWDQVNVLEKQGGWEIGSHSHTHQFLTNLPPNEIEHELESSKKILEAKGLSAVGFASPYGYFNEEILKMIKKYYKYHRNAWQPGMHGFNTLKNLDKYNISCILTYYDTSFEEIKWKIDKAILEKKWLVLGFHKVVKGRVEEDYQVNSQLLEQMADYLKKKNVKVITISALLKKYKLLDR